MTATAPPAPASATETRTLGYQPALDGLRAFAVVAVLLYHENIGRDAAIGILPGGFLGVDIFFVLSGFLITGILLADQARTGRVASTQFWIRRARRLLPALFLLLLLVSVYAVTTAPTYSLGDLRRESVAALFYVSNWVGIATASPQITPLSHLWSLAVEEQWYLVFPLLLVGILAVGRRRPWLLGALLGLAAVSFGLMVALYSPADAQRVAAGTDTRAWELLLGGALAVALRSGAPRLGTPASRVLDAAAVGAIAFLVWCFLTVGQTDEWLNHGGLGIVAVAALVVVLAAVDPGGRVVRPLLGRRPLVAIGLVSYGLYLYHLLVYIWLSGDRTGLDGPALLAVRLGALALLAVASYRWLEMPVRHGRIAVARRFVALPVSVVVVLGVVLVATRGAEPAPLSTLTLQQYRTLAASTPAGATRVLIAGDSSAFAMGWKVRPPIDLDGIRGTVTATLGCGIAGGRPVVDGRPVPAPSCPSWSQIFDDAVDAFDPAVSVLMVGNGEVFDRRIDGRVLRVGSPDLARHLRARLEEARRVLASDGRRLLLLSVPCAQPVDPADPRSAAVRADANRVAWLNSIWRDFAAAHPHTVRLADLGAVLCPGGDPHPVLGAEALRPDGVTVSATGASVVWRWIAPLARELAGDGTGPGS